jgi:uncharacterized Zn-finger protein
MASVDRSAPNPTIQFSSSSTRNDEPQNKARLPLLCEDCPKTFSCLEHLKRHRIFHTCDKPFKCPLCQRKLIFKKSDEITKINKKYRYSDFEF